MKEKKWLAVPVFLLAWALMVLSLCNQNQYFVYLILGSGCALQLYLNSFRKKYLLFMLLVGSFGWALESVESYTNILRVMGQNPQPYWLLLLWPYYVSVTFDLFLKFVNSYLKAFFYGASSLPGAYYLVSKFGIVEIGTSTFKFFIVNGTVGGLVLVFSCFIYYSLKVDKM